MRLHRIVGGVVAVVLILASLAQAAPGGWVLLGERTVTDREDHDTIQAQGRGTFRSIKLEVRRHAVDFHRVVIHFANGGTQPVSLRYTIPAGGESRIIDIEGGDRAIRRIELWYDAKSFGKGGSATVRVLGRG